MGYNDTSMTVYKGRKLLWPKISVNAKTNMITWNLIVELINETQMKLFNDTNENV